MTELWTFQIAEFEAPDAPALPDLVGYDVEATDGHIGKVDEATYEAGSSHIVVDTGFWIFGKKRMIPAGVIERIEPEERKVFVFLSKDEIKRAPEYDQARCEEEGYRKELSDFYDRGR